MARFDAVHGSRSDVVRVEVAASVVEINHDERERLLRRLRIGGGFDTIIAKFAAADSGAAVVLDFIERLRLRVALEFWADGSELPDRVARLLVVLEHAD